MELSKDVGDEALRDTGPDRTRTDRPTGTVAMWRHDHIFGQDRARPGERRTFAVIVITATTMVLEIIAGVAFGSMALLADGLHMASHTFALAIAAFAYVYARRRAHDETFSFGTGKVNSLGGFAGALLLGVFALLMGGKSIDRFFHPVTIAFDQAIFVAVVGLVVNAVSVVILGGHHHGRNREAAPAHHAHGDHVHDHGDDASDHNLRSAYLHVLADALTSLLAIVALLAGKFLGQTWLDPAMGIVGAALVAHWSFGLARSTTRVLLDRQGPEPVLAVIREGIESRDGNRVTDLHLWSIGPGIFAAVVSVVTDRPKSAEHYKSLLLPGLGIVHLTVEVYHRRRPPQ